MHQPHTKPTSLIPCLNSNSALRSIFIFTN
uniref:Uncharacterized protein n=1 Tax=Arundo donax TaxID=35708 RepID=A0A0A8Y822_ARUDO